MDDLWAIAHRAGPWSVSFVLLKSEGMRLQSYSFIYILFYCDFYSALEFYILIIGISEVIVLDFTSLCKIFFHASHLLWCRESQSCKHLELFKSFSLTYDFCSSSIFLTIFFYCLFRDIMSLNNVISRLSVVHSLKT